MITDRIVENELLEHKETFANNDTLAHVKVSKDLPKMNGTANAGTIDGNVSAKDHVHPSDSNKVDRVNLTGQVQIVSHRRSVIALCELTNTNINFNSWSAGKLIFNRYNGLPDNPTFVSEIAVNKEYNSTRMQIFILTTLSSVRPCTFVYNGKKYGGVEFFVAPSSSDKVYFEGETTIDIFGIDYFDTQNNIVLNTEINNSLSFTTDVVHRLKNYYLNGNPLWDNNNIPVESGVFTPTLAGNTTAGEFAYGANRLGHYYRVGKLMHFTLTVEISAITTAPAGDLLIKGLPFAVKSGLAINAISIYYVRGINIPTNFRQLVAGAGANLTYLALYWLTGIDGSAIIPIATGATAIKSDFRINLAGTYEIS